MSMRYYGLKYLRVIRYYFQSKYELSQFNFELLLFLHGERYFDQSTFNKGAFLWKWDKKLIFELIDAGWLRQFRGGKDPTYTLTKKANAIINQFYEILDGERTIPEDPDDNKYFKEYDDMPEKNRYNNFRYRKMIMKMNKEIRDLKKPPALNS